MKVLFLDFDGVLNLYPQISRGIDFYKPACVNLELLLKKVPDLKIVVSSAWRMHGLQYVKNVLQHNGIDPRRVIDITGEEKIGGQPHRGHQIQCWLVAHPGVTKFAILDDFSDMEPYMNKLVKTSSYIGLTQANVEKVLEILDEK